MLDWIRKQLSKKGRTDAKRELAKADPTENYQPRRNMMWQYDSIGDLPLWSIRFGRAQLFKDPMIRFAFHIRNAVLSHGEVEIDAANPTVKEWVEKSWALLWGQHRTAISNAKKWGYYGVQVEYSLVNGLLEIEGLKSFAPEDVRLLHIHNKPVGFSLNRTEKLFAPQAIPLTYQSEGGEIYGNPILRRQYPPWFEKWMDHGAKETKILRLMKDAYRSDVIRYPRETTYQTPSGNTVTARDLARELMENMLNGGALAIESDIDANGNKKWDYTPPHDTGNPLAVFNWEKGLDEEILIAADVPPEVVKAAETGSGFSGRSVPLMVLLGVASDEFSAIVQQVVDYCLKPCAVLNFGTDDFEVKPVSILEAFSEDTQGTSMGGGAIGGNHGGNGGGGDGGNGFPFSGNGGGNGASFSINGGTATYGGNGLSNARFANWQPYQGPRGGKGWKNAEPGEINEVSKEVGLILAGEAPAQFAERPKRNNKNQVPDAIADTAQAQASKTLDEAKNRMRQLLKKND